jgi:hypothetical protein
MNTPGLADTTDTVNIHFLTPVAPSHVITSQTTT